MTDNSPFLIVEIVSASIFTSIVIVIQILDQ